ncbi:DUF503 domain-containing protein [Calderihabitans maritimus]|uniref:DUF503 domain-containing protein n=1 Tax=Calderihabitans maritimus TaxID=1246530 RepID=A0A1Z5HP50_9FIRM|nr:DUF503 domain-containing protein [Calderihabitans maritimus]GAW91303.1 hypothetical protein KKC1_04650 [Calderihabitans maritimus]
MVVGLCIMRLHLAEANSLKDKRRVLRSLIDRVRSKFNVSIAEIGEQERWHLASVGIAVVSNETSHVHQMLSRLISFVENDAETELLEVHTEIL